MKVYLAGRYDRIDDLNIYASELRERGHEVNCRWLLGTHQLHANPEKVDAEADQVPMEAQPFAQDDLEDVAACDVLILFSEPPNSHSKRGGRHVEFGLALGMGKPVAIVGPRENVFHCLPQVKQFETWEDCLNSFSPEAL